MSKRFRLEVFGGPEDGADVLGAEVSEDNVYIATYGSLVRGKAPRELAVGETCVKRYALSAQKPTDYRIRRVS